MQEPIAVAALGCLGAVLALTGGCAAPVEDGGRGGGSPGYVSGGAGDEDAVLEGGDGGDEATDQTSDPYVIVPYPPPVTTPRYTTPGHGAPWYSPGYGTPRAGGHPGRPPPGWDRASWGRACQIAAAMAGSVGCLLITAKCAIGTTISVGGMAIPCALFIGFACTAATGTARAYQQMCPK